MLARTGSPCDLIIYKQISAVHFPYQFIERFFKLFLAYRYPDLQRVRAPEKAIHMFIQRKNMIIPARPRIVHTVAEPADTIIHRNRHLIQRSVFSIIIAKTFHFSSSLSVTHPQSKVICNHK